MYKLSNDVMVELYNELKPYADREDLLLKLILKHQIESTTYAELSNKMRDLGHVDYGWQTARKDLRKLGIVKWINRTKKPNIIRINLKNAQIKYDRRKKEKKQPIFKKEIKDDPLEGYDYSNFFSMDDINELNGFEFEYFLKLLFLKMGYDVQNTNLSNDQGADLIITRLNSKIAVQAKNHVGKVTNRAVQEVVASIAYYDATRGIVVTNSYFTKSAIDLAEANNVDLIDGNKLQRLIEKYPINKRSL